MAESLYDQVKLAIETLKTQLVAAKADGRITVAEIFQLVGEAVSLLVAAASTLSVSGADKKQLVTDAAQKLYDEVIRPIDIPGIPNVIENTIVDPAIGKAIPYIVSGLIEVFVRRLPAA